MNKRDFTNDHVTYGFYDAFVLDVFPKLVSKRGGTKLTIKGFGFVDSGKNEIRLDKNLLWVTTYVHCTYMYACGRSLFQSIQYTSTYE